MSRRWRYPKSRRGAFFDYPRTPPPPPDVSGPVGRYQRFGLRVRRGLFLWVPPTAVTLPAAPTYPPGFIRQAIRRVLFGRRGGYAEPPWGQQAQPPVPSAVRRRTTGLARRGAYQWVPPAAPVVGASGPLVQPPFRQAIRRGFLARRGQFYKIPLVGGAPLTPATWPPPIITMRRHRTYPTRRRATFSVPVSQLAPVPFQTCRRKPARPTRPGRFFQPPWPQIVTTPPTYPPPRIVARRRPIPRPRGMHCRFFEPGWPQAIQIGPPPVVFGRARVDAGTTAGALVGAASAPSGATGASTAPYGATDTGTTATGRTGAADTAHGEGGGDI